MFGKKTLMIKPRSSMSKVSYSNRMLSSVSVTQSSISNKKSNATSNYNFFYALIFLSPGKIQTIYLMDIRMFLKRDWRTTSSLLNAFSFDISKAT